MQRGLTITAFDPDQDYLGIEVAASNERFAGSAYIYAGVEELSELAPKMDGFPRSYEDRRNHEFGNRDPGFAGGFVSITLRCVDRAGHLAVDLVLEDDAGRYPRAHAAFGFQTEPAALDYFIESLRKVERDRFGAASLCLGKPLYADPRPTAMPSAGPFARETDTGGVRGRPGEVRNLDPPEPGEDGIGFSDAGDLLQRRAAESFADFSGGGPFGIRQSPRDRKGELGGSDSQLRGTHSGAGVSH